MQLPIRGPLAFPGTRAPGYDPTHIASSSKMRFSAVGGIGGAMFPIFTAGQLSVTGSPTTVSTVVGPALNIQANQGYGNTANAVSETPSAVTFGAIIIPVTSVTEGVWFANANSTAFDGLYSNAFQIGMRFAASNILSGITLSSNVPYFVAASYNGTTYNFIVVNLLTGAIKTSSGSVTYAFSAASIYFVGITFSAADSCGGQIAAIMHSVNYTALPELIKWAASPWDFWYPPVVDDFIASLTGGLRGHISGLARSIAFGANRGAMVGNTSGFAASCIATTARVAGAQRIGMGASSPASAAARGSLPGRVAASVRSSVLATAEGASRLSVAGAALSTASNASRGSFAVSIASLARSGVVAVSRGVGGLRVTGAARSLASAASRGTFAGVGSLVAVARSGVAALARGSGSIAVTGVAQTLVSAASRGSMIGVGTLVGAARSIVAVAASVAGALAIPGATRSAASGSSRGSIAGLGFLAGMVRSGAIAAARGANKLTVAGSAQAQASATAGGASRLGVAATARSIIVGASRAAVGSKIFGAARSVATAASRGSMSGAGVLVGVARSGVASFGRGVGALRIMGAARAQSTTSAVGGASMLIVAFARSSIVTTGRGAFTGIGVLFADGLSIAVTSARGASRLAIKGAGYSIASVSAPYRYVRALTIDYHYLLTAASQTLSRRAPTSAVSKIAPPEINSRKAP